MASLKELKAAASDLTGLEYATNLTALHLKKINNITDVTPLSELTNLIELYPVEYKLMRYADNNYLEDINDRFIEAIRTGNAKAIRDLIAQGVIPGTIQDKDGLTAWELAYDVGHKAVKALESSVPDLSDLLEDGGEPRVPCPICGTFDTVGGFDFEPACSHFIYATPTEKYTQGNYIVEDIVFEVADAVEEYIDQGAAQLLSQLGRENSQEEEKAREKFKSSLINSAPKSIAPVIKMIIDCGDTWWTDYKSHHVKEGPTVMLIEGSGGWNYQKFYHPNSTLFADARKKNALSVMKWLVKQGYVADESELEN